MDFKQAKQQADENKSLKQADFAESKTPFCIMSATRQEGEYKGNPTVQYLANVVFLKNGKRQSASIYISGKYLINILENLDLPCHNVFLFMDNKSYGMDQHSGACPCKHGTNGNVSRETVQESAEAFTETLPESVDDILSSYGFETVEPPLTEKTKNAVITICHALKTAVPMALDEWNEKEASDFILSLRSKHAGVSK